MLVETLQKAGLESKATGTSPRKKAGGRALGQELAVEQEKIGERPAGTRFGKRADVNFQTPRAV